MEELTYTMMELVSVNGILQSRHAYMVVGDCIVFHSAPPAGSEIAIMIDRCRTEDVGNGTTVVFPVAISPELQFKQFMDKVWEQRENPTVKDTLEKLRVVMELVR